GDGEPEVEGAGEARGEEAGVVRRLADLGEGHLASLAEEAGGLVPRVERIADAGEEGHASAGRPPHAEVDDGVRVEGVEQVALVAPKDLPPDGLHVAAGTDTAREPDV